MPRIAPILLLQSATALWSIPAQAIGFGVEGGTTFTATSGVDASHGTIWSGNAGLLVEDVFPIGRVFLDPWADVQTPIEMQNGFALTGTPDYVPIDLGLRFGLRFGLLQPYCGVVGQAAILTDSKGTTLLDNPVWALGGDLGLDIAVSLFRIGFELRALQNVSSLVTDGTIGPASRYHSFGGAFEFEALASFRLSL